MESGRGDKDVVLSPRQGFFREASDERLSWPYSSTKLWNIPPPVRSFSGRREELEIVASLLADGESKPSISRGRSAALSGMGGVGKTQLARAYAHRNRTKYQVGWWISAEDPVRLRAALGQLADHLLDEKPERPDQRAGTSREESDAAREERRLAAYG